MEKHDTSLAAKVISIISIGFIIFSTIGMIINTLPDIYLLDDKGDQAGTYLDFLSFWNNNLIFLYFR